MGMAEVTNLGPKWKPDWLPGSKIIEWDGFNLLVECTDGSRRRVEHIGTCEMQMRINELEAEIKQREHIIAQQQIDKQTARAALYWIAAIAGPACSQGEDVSSRCWAIAMESDFSDVREKFLQRSAPQFVRDRFKSLFQTLDDRAPATKLDRS